MQTQLANTLIDIGVVGLILYFWIIVVAYKETKKFFYLIYSKEIHAPFLYAIANAALASVFMYIFSITYHGIWWSVYSSFPFWFFMAIVYKYNHNIIKFN